jgi:choline dehydrogenase-like flavoprotein
MTIEPGGRDALLAAVIETIVPADSSPSAVETGGLDFLRSLLDGERPGWRDRLERVLAAVRRRAPGFVQLDPAARLDVLDTFADDGDYRWFARLVQRGYLADPGNLGNRDAASWRDLGWQPAPAGGWPELDEVFELDRRAFVTPAVLAERYDAIVIGSGAGGGVAAAALAEAGRRVLVVERGDMPHRNHLWQDHLRNARTPVGLDDRTAPTADEPRTLEVGGRVLTLTATDGRWGNNAMTVGGGTRVYGAQAWRFSPEDFRMASTYGVPEGSALSDWPIDYADLEPYYSRAEWEVGVSGDATGNSADGPRSRDYPMPPLPTTTAARLLAAGAARLGLQTSTVPLLISSRPWLGRPACARCSQCIGFACPIEAKNGSHNTMLARAVATGRASILTGVRAERLVPDERGRIVGVALVGEVDGALWRATVGAAEIVVAAGAVESARLLLNSPTPREPHGVGNNQDQVGRHLQGHLYAGATGVFEDPINDLAGPGPAIATNDFRHRNPGVVGGGMLANEFVTTPVLDHAYLDGAGMLPLHGTAMKEAMRWLSPRMHRVVGPIQEITTAGSRVRLDPQLVDRFGIPVVRFSGEVHAEDLKAAAFMTERAAEWLTASGATHVIGVPPRGAGAGPSSGQHQAGTARMGDDPSRSVTDPMGRVWGHDNVRVADGSLHVTNGGVNPVLTIFANSMRVMDDMVR